jgi:CDP-diacylglycerol--glycerol-3-phosphate 3-phosphatidyltransferase
VTELFLGVLGAAFLSMGAYALLGPGPDRDAQRRGSRFLLGLGDFFLHWFLWALGPVEAAALRLGVGPHAFNFAGLVLGLLSGVMIGLGQLELGGWAIILGGACDVLDGRVARATNTASLYGKFIDSTLDRFVEVFVFLGFVFYLRQTPLGSFVAAASLGGSLLVSYAQSRGETVGVRGAGGLMQRAERMVVTSLACLVDPSLSRWLGRPPGNVVFWSLCVIALGTFGTAIYRTVWISLRLRQEGTPGPKAARQHEEAS